MLPPADDSMTAVSRDPKVPFGPQFFKTILPDRVQVLCPGQGDQVPVVFLDLADGRRLDLCHIELLTPSWMAVAAFRDKPACEDMDIVFVPYELIALVTIGKRNPSQRSVGFQREAAPRSADGGVMESSTGPESPPRCA